MDIFAAPRDRDKPKDDAKDKHDILEPAAPSCDYNDPNFLMTAYMEYSSILTVIGGYTSLMLEGETGDLNAAQLESVSHIRQSTLQMSNLTQDMVDLIRLQSGQWEFHKTEVDLKELITGTWSYFKDRIVKKGMKIDGKIEGDKCTVFGDAEALRKALIRVFGNSMVLCQGGTNIFLSITRETEDSWLISIRDNGPGLSEGERPHLFTPFYCYKDLEVSDSESNMGLTMVMARMIVNNHGGELWVESERGKGSTIYLSLPSPRMPGRKKILIIEDNTIIAMMYETKLKKLYNVTIAHSGKDGLEKARIEKPDLIILDILMPEMDGFGVCRELKRSKALKDIPVVFLSNLIQSNLLKQVKDAGALDLLHKSNITPSNLADKIKEIFENLDGKKN